MYQAYSAQRFILLLLFDAYEDSKDLRHEKTVLSLNEEQFVSFKTK